MVGHEHVLVAHFFVDLKSFDKVNVPFIRIGFDKVVAMAANVAEVHVENLISRAEVANHVEDLSAGVGKHLADGALAKIEAVIGILLNLDEPLDPIDGSENTLYSLITGRGNARIVRMQGHTNLVLAGNGDDPIEKVRDALPRRVRTDRTGTGQWRLRFRLRELPGTVGRVSAARGARNTQISDDLQVVLDGRNAGHGAVLDERLEVFDVAITLRALAQHDGGMLILVHRNGSEEWRCGHIHLDAVGGRQILHAMQFFHRGIETPVGNQRIAADVAYAIASEILQVSFICGLSLTAKLHQ